MNSSAYRGGKASKSKGETKEIGYFGFRDGFPVSISIAGRHRAYAFNDTSTVWLIGEARHQNLKGKVCRGSKCNAGAQSILMRFLRVFSFYTNQYQSILMRLRVFSF